MSVLDDVLREEYQRLDRIICLCEFELKNIDKQKQPTRCKELEAAVKSARKDQRRIRKVTFPVKAKKIKHREK